MFKNTFKLNVNVLKFNVEVKLRLVNLKENHSCESALATVEIEIESAKRENLCAIKVLHGYGSHGKGGVILKELRKQLSQWKKSGFIKDYFPGDKWNIFEKDTMEILYKDKNLSDDCDLGTCNPGITIIRIN